MADARTLRSIFQLAGAASRADAAQALAARLGADALFIFVRDPEVKVLVPAPGVRQTLPGGPAWRSFLGACVERGVHQGQVAYPDQSTLRAATAFIVDDGSTFVFVGEPVALDEDERGALALAGALLRAEHSAVIATGMTIAAREAAQHARMLTNALDVTRSDLEQALTESARLNRELTNAADREREARAEAEKANRAKDEFLAMLGHELRNPLAPIVTALQLIKLRGDGGSREHEIVERQIEHVIRLVDDLLDVSRITRGKVDLERAPVELARVVAKAVEMASPLLERRRHRFSVSVPARGMMLHADEARLAQVLSNLLTNAARYTPAGGEISMRATRVGGDVEIAVRDSGIGIEPAILPHIFDLFVQGKRSSDRAEGGLGLGLALVRNLVSMHGGTVEAHSEGRNCGSVFLVRLPALPADVVAPAVEPRAPRPAQASAVRSLRVLIVDDNRDAAELLAEAVRLQGHEVVVVHDGPEALGVVEDFDPDTAILDIGLPVMDGYELARHLRARPLGRETRLIAVTGYGQENDRAQAKAAGFDSHLVKPVQLSVLMELLSV
ncbi:MAG: two-component hybrid sensor and regulator [Myxococcales bacterium]|nr:two-component hybrid sensor and regulator [Myxococcales bacterium]